MKRIIAVDGYAGINVDGKHDDVTPHRLMYGTPIVKEDDKGTTVTHGSITRHYPGMKWQDAVDAFYDRYPVVDGGFGIG